MLGTKKAIDGLSDLFSSIIFEACEFKILRFSHDDT